jgi:hypothetical protein
MWLLSRKILFDPYKYIVLLSQLKELSNYNYDLKQIYNYEGKLAEY